MNGACNGTFFSDPAPWGPGEESNDQISLNSYYKVNFKDFWGRMLVRSPILTIAFRPHVDIRSCTVEHIKMLHLYPIFHHMCCKVSGFMVDLEAER